MWFAVGDLEIGCEHSLPPGPVVACVVAPDVEAARDTFVAEDLRHAFVIVPALVVNAGGEDVGVTPVAVEIPGVADVGEVVHGDVEVAVVVVVAGEKVGGVEGSAHGEHGGEDVGMAEGECSWRGSRRSWCRWSPGRSIDFADGREGQTSFMMYCSYWTWRAMRQREGRCGCTSSRRRPSRRSRAGGGRVRVCRGRC